MNPPVTIDSRERGAKYIDFLKETIEFERKRGKTYPKRESGGWVDIRFSCAERRSERRVSAMLLFTT
jgi:hypothetical protein